ncbi:MAG: helicase-related protein [bacterium]
MPRIFDNIENHLVRALNQTLEVSHRSDFCVGYFNLRGWKEVADHIDKWQGDENSRCRLLIGMQRLPKDLIRDFFSLKADEMMDNKAAVEIRKKLAEEFKEQLTIGIPTDEDESGLRKLSSQIKDKKVIVKLYLRHPLHAKLYLLFRNDNINPITGYLGSSNLTLSGLSKQGELNIDVLDHDAAEKLEKWFEDRWNDRWCIDISEELAEIIDASWAGDRLLSPYCIYLKMAYHLSQEAIAGITQFKLPKEFEAQLFEFQQKAVLIAARHLHKRGGVIIGDVVGLGKTYTATALARIFEDDFFLETLILCPRNLVKMWEDYTHKYRLRAKILSYSLVLKELPDLRRYRIVVLDESHNLRNREGKRYKAIQEYIQLNDSKVIMLSATPYNKTYLDISNQLRLFLDENRDLGVSPEFFINHIGGRVQFSAQFQVGIRTIAAFERSDFADDWRELMRLFLVRRTRSFIKDNYAREDPANGRKYLEFPDGTRSYFPDRIPKKVEYDFDPDDPNDQYAKLYSETVMDYINALSLPRYGLGNYLDEKSPVTPTKAEEIVIDNLSRAGKRLMGFCRTNLFKRLESSGYAFLLSISRQILRNAIFVYAIDNKLPFPIGTQEANMLDAFIEQDTDLDDTGNTSFINLILDEATFYEQAEKIYQSFASKYRTRFDWINSRLFNKSLKKELIADSRHLLEILKIGKDWDPEADRQLNALFDLLTKKHRNDKVLVFTQFADTANYLTNELDKRKVRQLECVTGDHDNPTAIAYRFSPISNEQTGIAGSTRELRVLITTDVLSEGQNLQDGHIIVNYDLPWAIIRLIQRAGRVDRIGQKSEEILCYSFLPEEGIERIINLRARLTGRIRENAEVVGADETFFEGDPINIQDLYNEKSGILDEEDDTEIDLASYAYQIWKNAIDADSKLKKIIADLPNVVYGTRALQAGEDREQGVIVYTRTADDNDALAWLDRNGNLVTQSQLAILKAAQCQPDTEPQFRLPEHHKLVQKGLAYIQEYESTLGGQLGKKSGARYRVYMRLDRFYRENQDTLFVNEKLKKAIDDIYKYPLREYARETLNRQLKAGISDDELADLVISLREEDKLSIISEEEETYKEPQIICSLGLKNV